MPDTDQGSENDTSGLFKSSLVKYFFTQGTQTKNIYKIKMFGCCSFYENSCKVKKSNKNQELRDDKTNSLTRRLRKKFEDFKICLEI